ncbi:MAG: serine hydrolase domain-containing protein [Phycisphaerales bacterium]|nr:serine hydrolase domain-containing protein [Phycisphaerales bacterium]
MKNKLSFLKKCTYAIFIFVLCASLIGVFSFTDNKIIANTNDQYYGYLSANDKNFYTDSIKTFYNKFLKKYGFNGDFLVAKNGKILFEQYSGLYNFRTEDSITPFTPIHLASISKTFTSAAILKLYQDGKLALDDNVDSYFPNFPYHNITIRLLLCHRSGLPNYVDLLESGGPVKQYLTNEDVLDYFIYQHPKMMFRPNTNFKYCNTNYVLLALIIEKITGMSLPDYLNDSIFKPLGMKNTYVFSEKNKDAYTPSYTRSLVPYSLRKLDCVYGDKNVYSTARDLLLWDDALYTHKILNQDVENLAFQGCSPHNSTNKNYGLGWRIFDDGKVKFVYHNGWWHGNNTSFIRLIGDTATIIVLSNKKDFLAYKAKKLAGLFYVTIPPSDDKEEMQPVSTQEGDDEGTEARGRSQLQTPVPVKANVPY